MRRSVVAVAAVAAALGWLPTSPAAASHTCAEGLEIVCFLGCPTPPKFCPWP
jgi:hypothetical protein